MPRRPLSLLGAERVAVPKKWAAQVRKAMKDAGGRITEAADALGVSRRTLYRWLDEDPRLAGIARAPEGRPPKD